MDKASVAQADQHIVGPQRIAVVCTKTIAGDAEAIDGVAGLAVLAVQLNPPHIPSASRRIVQSVEHRVLVSDAR